MPQNRQLIWDGCVNVRDLGGLTTITGGITRWGAVVRSDNPAKLTAAGWSALYDHGVRTIIRLATDGKVEETPDRAPRPADLDTIRCAIEDLADTEFLHQWAATDLWCTPLYYNDALRRWPERHAAVLKAIAAARPGGILIHCERGNDRTGIITMLLLAAVGVIPEEIAVDYVCSPDDDRDSLLVQQHTTSRDVILAALAQLDVEPYLRSGGLTEAELDSVRARLIDDELV